jgi:hypothetical protein
MTCLPQPRSPYRAPRLRVTDLTPAVLRLRDGGCTTGSLEVISLTGGLLCLSKPVDRGSRVKLMFLSQNGPVLGTAEMLSPVSWTRQPFRFLALSYGDQRRLQTATQWSPQPEARAQAIESSRTVNREEHWIEKYRAVISHRKQPRRLLKIMLGAGLLATLSLGYAVYLLSLHLK